jgi:hypothetical protein
MLSHSGQAEVLARRWLQESHKVANARMCLGVCKEGNMSECCVMKFKLALFDITC